MPGAAVAAADLARVVDSQGFLPLPISFAHGQRAGSLGGPHQDPFDRMLMAQAMLDDLVLVSDGQRFDTYGVLRLW